MPILADSTTCIKFIALEKRKHRRCEYDWSIGMPCATAGSNALGFPTEFGFARA
jgi:hypothetical protein